MKATDIIDAMCYDSALAEYGNVWNFFTYSDTHKLIEDYFGDFELAMGELTPGKYFLVWEANGNDVYPFQVEHPAEVILQRNNPQDYDEFDRQIWLWKIENN